MDQAIKEQWVAALRSGEYEQGIRSLNRDGKFCCLGVLCDLAVKAGVLPAGTHLDGGSDTYYDGVSELPPLSVQQWAGLDDNNPSVEYDPGDGSKGTRSLAELNDGETPDARKRTFAEIADMIETQL